MNAERSVETAQVAKASADFRWLEKSEHWGEWERFDEVTGERESIWMMKSTSGPQVRFYGIGKGQVGPRHKHLVAATYWGYGTGYLQVREDPMDIFIEIACRAEVLAGGVADDANGSGVST